jgi:membrane protein implicated in regulation of membrane protease activity
LGTTAFLVVVFTIAGYATGRAAAPSSAGWAIVAVAYAVLSFVLYINHWVVERNVSEAGVAHQTYELPGGTGSEAD